MKTVILALLVLVVVSQGEALICNCGGTLKPPCSGSVETCYGSGQVCGSITLHGGPHVTYAKGCMNADDCRRFSSSPEVSIGTCCNRDRCN